MSERRIGATASDGQASIALVAVIPALVLALAVLLQVALVGFTAWAAAGAARAAARAELVGSDPVAAARAALPGPLRDRFEVDSGDRPPIRVTVRPPRLLPLISGPALTAGASLAPADDRRG